MRSLTLRTAVAALSITMAACASTSSSSQPSVTASATPESTPAASISTAPASTSATASPAASAVGRLPVGRIVFDRLVGNPEGRFEGMFVLGTDGAEQEVKLPTPVDEVEGVWSTDGRKLLVNEYSDAAGGSTGILDLASGQLTPIRPKGLAGDLSCSDWSPDDKTLVCDYGSAANVRDGLYLVDVASDTAMRLTTSPYHDTVGSAGECGGGEGRGVFSPDGLQIAYEQQKCGKGADPSSDEEGDIVVIPAAGGKPTVVVPLGGVKTHPGGEISWSPDGRLIAFGTQEDGHLTVVAPDGSGLRRLPLPTELSGAYAYGPAWSPDGSWLLATFATYAGSDLYAVDADGTQAIQLTNTDLVEAYTDWGPAAP